MTELSCKTCGETKPTTAFWKQRSKRGFMAECKACSIVRNRRWVDQNREQHRETNLRATHRYRKNDPRQRLLDYAKRRAARDGLGFDLTVDDLDWPSHCPVLGIELISTFGSGGRSGAHAHSPSLDRIDNLLGYVRGNVVVVSWRANRLKCDATAEELRKVADFYGDLQQSPKAGEIHLSGVRADPQTQAGQELERVDGGRGTGLVLSQSGL